MLKGDIVTPERWPGGALKNRNRQPTPSSEDEFEGLGRWNQAVCPDRGSKGLEAKSMRTNII